MPLRPLRPSATRQPHCQLFGPGGGAEVGIDCAPAPNWCRFSHTGQDPRRALKCSCPPRQRSFRSRPRRRRSLGGMARTLLRPRGEVQHGARTGASLPAACSTVAGGGQGDRDPQPARELHAGAGRFCRTPAPPTRRSCVGESALRPGPPRSRPRWGRRGPRRGRGGVPGRARSPVWPPRCRTPPGPRRGPRNGAVPPLHGSGALLPTAGRSPDARTSRGGDPSSSPLARRSRSPNLTSHTTTTHQ